MSDMRPKLKRALSFTLIPLSAVPFVAAVPLVGPSIERRVDPPDAPVAHVRPLPPRPEQVAIRERWRAVDEHKVAQRVIDR